MNKRTGGWVTDTQLYGTSVKSLPNLSDICDQCEQTLGQPYQIAGNTAELRITKNLAPLRRMVKKQRVEPLMIGLGLTPVVERSGKSVLGNHFYSQVVAYGESREHAELLLRVHRTMLSSGYSAVLTSQDEDAALWQNTLRSATPSRKRPRSMQSTVAAEHASLLTPTTASDAIARAIDLMSAAIRETIQSSSDIAALLIPFRTARAEDHSYFRGCWFSVITASELTEDHIKSVWLCTSILHHAPFRPVGMPRVPGTSDLLQRFPGPRLKLMVEKSPDMLEIFEKYPQLEAMIPDIESGNMDAKSLAHVAWTLMTGEGPRSLRYWRKKAGLPDRD